MKNKKHFIYLGYSSFPYGLAEVQKIILISKSLIYTNNQGTVICRNGLHNKSLHPELKTRGEFEGIQYIYVSGSCFRNNNFFKRRYNEVMGKLNEFLLLWKLKRKNKLDFAILNARGRFLTVFYYSLLARIFKFIIILNYAEFHAAIKSKERRGLIYLNDRLFDQFAFKMVHAVLPISEFLVEQIVRRTPGKKYFKVPVLTDFDKYVHIGELMKEPYFLFCGDAVYKEIVYFIIDSYSLVKSTAPYYLYLVVSGKEGDREQIKQYAEKVKNLKTVKIFSGLTEIELYSLYKNARALLIPLRPTLQDEARFPHKTGEYLASGNPVISTNYGEMKYYFKDSENMLLAESYEVIRFSEKMQFIIDYPDYAKKIGLKGKDLAAELFDYKKNAHALNLFLRSLL